MTITIDRFEGDYAVVETLDRMMYNIPKELLPDAKEGDMFDIVRRENFRKEKIKKLMDDVWAD